MLSQALVNEIREICRREHVVDKLFIMERIPQKKFNNAVKSYAANMGQDERVLFLYDDTVFGSSKEGFILTSHALYSKNILESGNFASIEEIMHMTYDAGLLSSSIMVRTEFDKFELQVTQANGSNEKTAVFNILNQTIKLLNGEVDREEAQVDLPSQPTFSPHCISCGAPVTRRARRCEYCDTSL